MTLNWQDLFTKSIFAWKDANSFKSLPAINSLEQLKYFLDIVHIKYCLAKPYRELSNYPLVDMRELLPSFESDPYENKELPGFSLVAFGRPLIYFNEIFQFDMLSPIHSSTRADYGHLRMEQNRHTMQSRLPRNLHESFHQKFSKENVTSLSTYPSLLPYLTTLDRGQVFGMSGENPQDLSFYLAGIYASFPSHLDVEVKRHGVRLGKFNLDDLDSYSKNRQLVLQHLMELYGFPISSERRTSAAMFARRLHKMGEKFIIRTLGQSDRTITTIWNTGQQTTYPLVEKTALVSVDKTAKDLVKQLKAGGYFLDEKKRVIILRVLYKQHKFSPDNVRQERAISVAGQEVIHPLTGEPLTSFNVIRESNNMLLILNDIVRGEYFGRIIYKRMEVVETTETEEKRLKFLYSWLSKHQRRIIGYGDEFFASIEKVLSGYLFDPDKDDAFEDAKELYNDVVAKYSFIHQARKVRVLEELQQRQLKGMKISYLEMLDEMLLVLNVLKFEIVNYYEAIVEAVNAIGDAVLNDSYLIRTYVEVPDEDLTAYGQLIKKRCGQLVAVLDEFRAIQRSRCSYAQSFQIGQFF